MTSHPIKSVKFDKKGECVKCFVSMTFQWFLNPFLDNVPILYPLKTLKNLRFLGVFRIYKTGALFINGFSTDSYKTLNENCKWIFCWSPVCLQEVVQKQSEKKLCKLYYTYTLFFLKEKCANIASKYFIQV